MLYMSHLIQMLCQETFGLLCSFKYSVFFFLYIPPAILGQVFWAAHREKTWPDHGDPLVPLLLQRFMGYLVPAAAVFQLESPDLCDLY